MSGLGSAPSLGCSLPPRAARGLRRLGQGCPCCPAHLGTGMGKGQRADRGCETGQAHLPTDHSASRSRGPSVPQPRSAPSSVVICTTLCSGLVWKMHRTAVGLWKLFSSVWLLKMNLHQSFRGSLPPTPSPLVSAALSERWSRVGAGNIPICSCSVSCVTPQNARCFPEGVEVRAVHRL